MYVRGYLQGSENGRVVTIATDPPSMIVTELYHLILWGKEKACYFPCIQFTHELCLKKTTKNSSSAYEFAFLYRIVT